MSPALENDRCLRKVDSTYPKFLKLLISGNISPNTHEYSGFRAFRPVCPFRLVCPVEPISVFYGQDGQEARNRVIGNYSPHLLCIRSHSLAESVPVARFAVIPVSRTFPYSTGKEVCSKGTLDSQQRDACAIVAVEKVSNKRN
jgi:hypothetical protein